MKDLWLRMIRRFGASRWTGQFGDFDDGSWDDALSIFPDHVLYQAVDRIIARGGEFLPDLRDLVAICLRQSGLPEPVAAYQRAVRYSWVHPVIYETARRIGMQRIRHGSESQTMPAWRETFGLVCIEFLRKAKWVESTTTMLDKRRQLASQREKSSPTAPEVAHARIAEIKRTLGLDRQERAHG